MTTVDRTRARWGSSGCAAVVVVDATEHGQVHDGSDGLRWLSQFVVGVRDGVDCLRRSRSIVELDVVVDDAADVAVVRASSRRKVTSSWRALRRDHRRASLGVSALRCCAARSPLPTDNISEYLTEKRTDVAFSVKMRVSGKALVLYALLEPQSTLKVWMALRVLEYMTAHWRGFIKTHPDARRLPPIVGIVVYHGESGWTCATRLVELLDTDVELGPLVEPFVPNFEYLVDDLSKAESDELRDRVLSATAKLARTCLSRARLDADYMPLLLSQLDLLRQVATSPNSFDW